MPRTIAAAIITNLLLKIFEASSSDLAFRARTIFTKARLLLRGATSPLRSERSRGLCLGNYLREPPDIIGPHLLVGDGGERSPERDGLGRFDGLAEEIFRNEDTAVKAVSIRTGNEAHLSTRVKEPQSPILRAFHAQLRQARFAGCSSARGVDFPAPQAALLADKENVFITKNEEQCGEFFGLPA